MLEDEVTELQKPLLALLGPFFSTIGLRLENAQSFSSQPDLKGTMQGHEIFLSEEKLDVGGNSLAQLVVRFVKVTLRP